MEALQHVELLDLPKDEEFERITSLCANALSVPICLVSLVDARRQWFLSNRGLGDVKETSRDLAFCGHAILPGEAGKTPEMFVVRDATEDDRFKDTALVTGWPHIRFYAGTPLLLAGPDGVARPIGTLCIIDVAEEHGGGGARGVEGFGVREKQILLDFGALVVGAIDARQASREALAVAKNDWLSCTAHDIRTPVACFQLSLELLAATGRLDAEQAEYVADARVSVEVITETVERAIETARQQRGARPAVARRERVDPRTLLDRVDRLTRALVEPRPRLVLTVDESVPEVVATDGTLLWRCLLNYVTNALKATSAAGGGDVDATFRVVDVSATGVSPPARCAALLCGLEGAAAASPLKRGRVLSDGGGGGGDDDWSDVVALAPASLPASGKWLKLEVSDRGVGVPRALRRSLFHAFVQTPGTKEGTGLGLLAVKRCAAILGGACGMRARRPGPAASPKRPRRTTAALPGDAPARGGVAARDDAGSVFWLLVPFDDASAAPGLESAEIDSRALAASPTPAHLAAMSPPPPAAAAGRISRTCLVVEDSAPIRKLLKRIVERCGFVVDEAGNGEAGLDALRAARYDVTIMDFLMPILDGVSCIRAYRAWERTAEARAGTRALIIGSSANADDHDVRAAYEAGMDDFLPKPVSTAALHVALARFDLAMLDLPPTAEAEAAAALQSLSPKPRFSFQREGLGEADIRDLPAPPVPVLAQWTNPALDDPEGPAIGLSRSTSGTCLAPGLPPP